MMNNGGATMTTSAPLIRMRDAGYYSAHTTGAKLVIDKALPLMLRALDAMDLSGPAPFAIADFGAADGGTSLALHRAVLTEFRTRAPHRQVTLTHTDLPHNDFSTLFRLVQGLLPGREGLGVPGVFSFASGTSFHEQVFPDATLALGFSATAMHWLSRLPATIAEDVHAVFATGPVREAFRIQAAADWERILIHRARELVPGGQMVFANFCVDEAGRYLGATGGRNMHERFGAHWRALHAAGAITRDEVARATFAQYYRSVSEFRAPFDAADGAARRAGLVLEECFTEVTPCPYAARFASGEWTAAAFARAYVPTLRSWSESMFAGALDPARDAAERQDIIDRFYAAYEEEVAAAPEGHGMDYVHCFMRVRRAA
jgi:hypothetical protein